MEALGESLENLDLRGPPPNPQSQTKSALKRRNTSRENGSGVTRGIRTSGRQGRSPTPILFPPPPRTIRSRSAASMATRSGSIAKQWKSRIWIASHRIPPVAVSSAPANGNPSGVLLDNAMSLVYAKIPPPSPAQLKLDFSAPRRNVRGSASPRCTMPAFRKASSRPTML